MGAGPISKLQDGPGEEGGRHKRWGEDITRAQAGSWDISPKAWDSLNMRSCCPAEEAEGQTYLEAILERDRVDICDVKVNTGRKV